MLLLYVESPGRTKLYPLPPLKIDHYSGLLKFKDTNTLRSPITETKMAKHSPRFEKLCEAARATSREVSIDQIHSRIVGGEKFLLVDVREDHEWAAGHLPGAVHLGRGIIERDVEVRVPDLHTEVVLYCGGGYRSALAAENLQKMGYDNVWSMAGGFRGWREAGLPVENAS
jgi:rhodanese-related sulfurtransferase